MKVGTDGVLLGAWIPPLGRGRILDVGTGTGLIALMLAQRNTKIQIDAIELDLGALQDARINFDQSPWSDRLNLIQGDFTSWSNTNHYDCIVSNPPFFEDSIPASSLSRSVARHQNHLQLNGFLRKAYQISTSQATVYLVLPFDQLSNLLEESTKEAWYLNHLVQVFTKSNQQNPKRILVTLEKVERLRTEEQLILHRLSDSEQKGRTVDQYSEAYKKLVRDFYLQL